MYETGVDPYCYPGTTILKNLRDLKSRAKLRAYERVMTAQRSEEPLPRGNFSVSHYYAVHRHIFQDVYRWAGKPRTVRITKGTSTFCYPENIAREMNRMFVLLRQAKFLSGMTRDEFSSHAAHFLADLNAIHPFRDGNGRVQLIFLALMAERAGFSFRHGKLKKRKFIDAMIRSFSGDETPLTTQILQLTD
jgi:cell filamentation protein, protein adenylyltransferase